MDKMIVLDPKKCTGCKTCEVVCSFVNSQQFSPIKSRIRNYVDLNAAFFYSLTCMQCEDAPCVKVCPAGALAREDGVVKVDASKCMGCKLCVLSCPFGAARFDEDDRVAIKCELCQGDPQCVAACPPGALKFEPIAKVGQGRQVHLFEKLKSAAAGC